MLLRFLLLQQISEINHLKKREGSLQGWILRCLCMVSRPTALGAQGQGIRGDAAKEISPKCVTSRKEKRNRKCPEASDPRQGHTLMIPI